MKFSRITVAPGTAASRTFEFEPNVAIVAESPEDSERLVRAFSDLYLGIEREYQIFATIDEIEFEMTSDMVPLVGERLDGEFSVVDLATPAEIDPDDANPDQVESTVARAALETLGAASPTLDLTHFDRAALTIDRSRREILNAAHTSSQRRTGLLQVFARRNRHDSLDANDAAVQRLERFDMVLADRRRQVSAHDEPSPSEMERAAAALRELASTRSGGMAPEMVATQDAATIERETAQWVAQQHDRLITPEVAEICTLHALGVGVLGSVPVVIDLRRVDGLLPGGDAMRWAARLHSDELQFIVLVADEDRRSWAESAFQSSSAA